MGTTVQEAQGTRYSDKSGYFYEGLRREDVKPYKGIKSLFHNANKEFDKIDSDHDGILSKDEITDKLHKNIDWANKCKKSSLIFAGLNALSAIDGAKSSSSKLSRVAKLAISALFVGAAVLQEKTEKTLEQRIAAAYGY